ncbi:hypothetical protein [Pedobacter jeongneungensis]|uniref:hypothetical protein n=1 Tax=Pedobacter jeongneungensis TaxID=947309 RepID=UPI000469EBCE|nr:hypothetical protein [Pedobacter jeongneungensis]
MKKLLIISPHFPPVNAADMQRIRTSLLYYSEFGWEAEIVTVHEKYVDILNDPLLLSSIPSNIKVHKVKAFAKKWTAKFGLGSLALRSLYFYRKKVNQLLASEEFDLIYFSTTEFPLCVLGAYWNKKFKVPYVIDMQDPWHTDYYKNKPRNERPKKYWFSYNLHKYLEPKAMDKVAGLISVSANYIDVLHQRYPKLKSRPSATITFGAFESDLETAKANAHELQLPYLQKKENFNLVYVGRGGHDMKLATKTLFTTYTKGLKENIELFASFKLHFIGTSYAPKGKGQTTISLLAKQFELSSYVREQTDRIGFYESLNALHQADGLIIIGSDQAAYTASKLYPYILVKKPLLAVFHSDSSVTSIIENCDAGQLIRFNDTAAQAYATLTSYLLNVKNKIDPLTNWDTFEPYTARFLTARQVDLFNEAIEE